MDSGSWVAGAEAPQSRARVRRWVRPVVYTGLVVALVLSALPTLLYPLTRDQGIYAYIADLMMHGGAPFRDAWELKPPAVYFAYWSAFLIFGRSEFAVRLFDVLYTLLSAASVGLLAWEAFRDRCIAALSAWLYAFCYYFVVHFHSMATPEAFMTPFLVTSIYGIVRSMRMPSSRLPVSSYRALAHSHWQLIAGVASGFVFWFKPTAGLPIVAVLVWACVAMCSLQEIQRGHSNRTRVWHALLTFFVGGLLGLLPIGLYLYGHGLSELLEIWRAYGTGAYLEARGLVLGDGPLAMLDVIVRYLRDWQLLAWLSLAGAVGALTRCRRSHSGKATVLPPAEMDTSSRPVGVVIFWLSSLAATLVQGKLFEYHWIPVLAPAAMLAAASLVWLAQEMQGQVNTLYDIRSIFVVVVIVGLSLWLSYDRLARYRSTVAYLAGHLSAEEYYAQFNIGQDFSAVGTRQAAAYLRAHTDADETALIWGVEPLVNFLAERRSPTNFISFYVLVSGQGRNPRLDAWRQDFMSDIRRKPPTYIVLVENDITPLAPVGSRAQLDDLLAFKNIIETEYEFEAQVEDYLFYRRRPTSSQGETLHASSRAAGRCAGGGRCTFYHGYEESFIYLA